MAEREGLTSTAFVLLRILANFCLYYKPYHSLATVAHLHSEIHEFRRERAVDQA